MCTLKPFHCAVRVTLLAVLLAVPQLEAAPLSPPARGEIERLLSRLGASGCQFQRNGSWYAAQDAQAHLQRKLDVLVDKAAVSSAEQFIERAASQSSMSGQAYQVKCASQPPVASGAWLRAKLREVRSEENKREPARPD